MKKTQLSCLPDTLRTFAVATRRPADLDDEIAARVTNSWHKAQDGLRHIVEFGALLLEVDKWLKARPGAKRGQGSYGLRNWLAENCPEVNYDTARGYREAAKGLLAAAQLAADRPLLALMGENPLTDEEEESARAKVMDVIASSSLRLLKAAARADRTELGRPKGGTSEGRRAKDPLTASEEWMQRAEAAANELGGVCMVVQAELLLANPDRLRVVRAHVKDCLAVLDGLVDKSEAL